MLCSRAYLRDRKTRTTATQTNSIAAHSNPFIAPNKRDCNAGRRVFGGRSTRHWLWHTPQAQTALLFSFLKPDTSRVLVPCSKGAGVLRAPTGFRFSEVVLGPEVLLVIGRFRSLANWLKNSQLGNCLLFSGNECLGASGRVARRGLHAHGADNMRNLEESKMRAARFI